jgi:phospholipid-binding lipoprotein MlaA
VWGFEEGPYLMLPLFGPSNLRDGTGRVADFWAHPTGAVLGAQGFGWISDAQMGADMLDSRTQLLDPMREIKRTSLDQYAAIRSLYRQNRDAAIADSERGQRPANPSRPGAAAAGPGEAGAGAAAATPAAKSGAIEFVDPAER